MLAIEVTPVTHVSDYLSDIVCMQDRWMIDTWLSPGGAPRPLHRALSRHGPARTLPGLRGRRHQLWYKLKHGVTFIVSCHVLLQENILSSIFLSIRSVYPRLLPLFPRSGWRRRGSRPGPGELWLVESRSRDHSTHLWLVQALLYVKNYAAGSEQWQGFPIQVSNTKHQGPKMTGL